MPDTRTVQEWLYRYVQAWATLRQAQTALQPLAVDLRGRYSNLPMSRLHGIRLLTKGDFGKRLHELHELVYRQKKAPAGEVDSKSHPTRPGR
jgi:hypothetical protein